MDLKEFSCDPQCRHARPPLKELREIDREKLRDADRVIEEFPAMNGFNRKVAAIQSNSVSFPVGLFSFPAGVESASDESR
jgi:hypothetical protein